MDFFIYIIIPHNTIYRNIHSPGTVFEPSEQFHFSSMWASLWGDFFKRT
jgi:hypothetical protein